MPSQSATREHAPSTRDRLVRAAADEFNRVGYGDTNTNKIARAAGFAPATFYRHFNDKREALIAAFEWSVLESRRNMGRALGELVDPTLEEASHAMVRVLVDHQKRWRTLIASWLMVAAGDPEQQAFLETKRNNDLDMMEAICQRYGGKPHARADNLLLLLTLEGVCVLLATGDPKKLGLSKKALSDQMARLIQAHVRG